VTPVGLPSNWLAKQTLSYILYIIEKKFTMQKMGFFGKNRCFLKNFSAGAPELTFWYFS